MNTGSAKSEVYEDLPDCPTCGAPLLFCYNETPDYWIKNYKAWFKCQSCGRMISKKRDRPFRILQIHTED